MTTFYNLTVPNILQYSFFLLEEIDEGYRSDSFLSSPQLLSAFLHWHMGLHYLILIVFFSVCQNGNCIKFSFTSFTLSLLCTSTGRCPGSLILKVSLPRIAIPRKHSCKPVNGLAFTLHFNMALKTNVGLQQCSQSRKLSVSFVYI